jgi:putative DNA primase/helicase
MDVLEKLDNALVVVHRRGEQRDALCPAHDDKSPSLTYGPGESGGVVLFCHAGCETADVMAALGMAMTELRGEPYVEASYLYTDEGHNLLWTVERWANPKDFRVRPGLPSPRDRVLYHMPWIAYARHSATPIYVVEGEKDADRLVSLGIPATCNVGGAGRGKWLAQYTQALKGLHVVVVADDDEPGRRHARFIADHLEGVAASVIRLVPKSGNDLSDHLDAGHRLDELQPLPELDTGATLLHPADIAITPVEWVWPGYIPRGAMTIIDGDPGDGKSVLTIDLAARWSTGALLPDGAPNPGPMDVVLVSAEDDPMVIATRLRAAGADLNRVHMLVSIRTVAGEERPFDLSTDLPLLEDVLRQTKAGVLILDPLMAFMNEQVDTYKDHHVRRVLQPYIELVRQYDSSLVVVRHLTKGSSKALYRGGGSIAFVGAARSAFLVAREAQDDEIRVLANIKANMGGRPAALRWRLRPAKAYDAPVVEWLGVSSSSAQQLIDADPRETSAQVEAMFFLRDYLIEAGSASWPELCQAARKAGMGSSEHTLRRAREDLGLTHTRTGFGPDSRTLWTLPEDWRPEPVSSTDSDIGTDPASPANSSRAHETSVVPNPTGTVPPDSMGTTGEPSNQPRTCDVCMATERVATFAADPALDVPECVRCLAHNPYVWDGQR